MNDIKWYLDESTQVFIRVQIMLTKKNVDMKHVSGKGTGYQNVPRGAKLASGNVPDGIFYR